MNFKDTLKELLEEYENLKKETPFYHNTEFCQVIGGVDELKSLVGNTSIDDANIGCYIRGRIQVLEELKRRCIFE